MLATASKFLVAPIAELDSNCVVWMSDARRSAADCGFNGSKRNGRFLARHAKRQ